MTRAFIYVALNAICLICLPGCQELADWRDSQIKTSHEIGQGTQIAIPDPPITIPGKLYQDLPLETGFTVLSYNENRTTMEISLVVLIDQELNEATMWLLTKMTGLGYASADNASRILEGVTYGPTGPSAKYESIYVKINCGDAGRSILHIKAKQG